MAKKTRRAKARRALLALSLVLVTMMVAVGGTIAWLTDASETLTNVFDTSKIGVTLAETPATYQMIPGHTISKDPKVTLDAGSVESYLFVELVEKGVTYSVTDPETQVTTTEQYDFNELLTYDVVQDDPATEAIEGWTMLAETPNTYHGMTSVWYIKATAGETKQVLVDNKVTTLSSVTKDMMDNIGTSKPELVITAYACQLKKDNTTDFTAAEAWAAINPSTGE